MLKTLPSVHFSWRFELVAKRASANTQKTLPMGRKETKKRLTIIV